MSGTIVVTPNLAGILDELADWHRKYEYAADSSDFETPGTTEAAQLSGWVGKLLAELGRPVRLG